MKKYIILLLPILILMFGSVSMAYSQADYEKIKDQAYRKWGQVLSENAIGQCLDYWEQNKTTYPYMVLRNYSGDYAMNYSRIEPTKSGNYLNLNGIYTANFAYNYNGTIQYDPYNQGASSFSVTYDKSIEFGTFDSFHEEDIDFTNLHYDPTIPTPTIWAVIDNGDNYQGSEDNQGNFTLPDVIPYALYLEGNSSLSEYYVYIGIRFYTPTGGTLERKSGFDYFTANDYIKSEIYDYIPLENLQQAGTASRVRYWLDSDLYSYPNTFWHNFRLNANENFEWNMIGYSSDAQKNKAKSITLQYLKNAGIYGNRTEVFVAYFQVRDGKIYISNYARWYSVQPETTTSEQLSNQLNNQDQNANGAQNVITPDQYEEQEQNTNNQPPLNITDYGTSVTVHVDNGTQYVPNNQNYPTIVSYNHDNIFTQFVGTYQSAGKYLGDFGNFVQSTFAWIPGQVWTLIIMGFGMALVIMILKII